MRDEQPIITPSSIVRLPQIPPQQVAARRQQYSRPVLARYMLLREMPVTPMPLPRCSTIGTRPPDTPLLVEQPGWPRLVTYCANSSTPGLPVFQYIPCETRRKEPSTGEALLGCAVLLVVSVLLVALLYYLSSAG